MYTKLRKLRNSHGYSCSYMGSKLNITGAYYSQIETGARNLSYNLACKIAAIFKMHPDEIFYDDHMENRLK